MPKNFFSVLNNLASNAAPRLLGSFLERSLNGHTIVVRIVETEAYDQTDIASHSYRGQTPRTKIMFGEAGFLYVYFTYGMHYCCNIVVGQPGNGSAVLLRAVEPLKGEAFMKLQRRGVSGKELTNGPAKLCQAMAIDKSLNGHDLQKKPLRLIIKNEVPSNVIVQTTRIGIREGKKAPWRFYIKDNPFVSKLWIK